MDKGKQIEKLVKHYSELFSKNIVVTSAFNTIEPLPIMAELDAEC